MEGETEEERQTRDEDETDQVGSFALLLSSSMYFSRSNCRILHFPSKYEHPQEKKSGWM